MYEHIGLKVKVLYARISFYAAFLSDPDGHNFVAVCFN